MLRTQARDGDETSVFTPRRPSVLVARLSGRVSG